MRSEKLEVWQRFWKNAARLQHDFIDAFYLMDRIKLAHLVSFVPAKTSKTLEVGAASGRLSRFLAALGYKVWCLDYFEEALTYAIGCFQKDKVHGTFVEGKAEELPFADETFDLVFSTGLLEHFENPEPLVRQMVRVLKGGGLFYSDIVPRKFSLLRSLDFVRPLLGREWDPLFEMKFSKQDIIRFLKNADLQHIRVFPAAIFPPRIPVLRGFPLIPFCESITAQFLAPLLRLLDGTFFAEWLGFYYFAYGYKMESFGSFEREKCNENRY